MAFYEISTKLNECRKREYLFTLSFFNMTNQRSTFCWKNARLKVLTVLLFGIRH